MPRLNKGDFIVANIPVDLPETKVPIGVYTKSSAKKETITYRNLKNINNENYSIYILMSYKNVLYLDIIILILTLLKYINI